MVGTIVVLNAAFVDGFHSIIFMMMGLNSHIFAIANLEGKGR
jgi:hypothetical protein